MLNIPDCSAEASEQREQTFDVREPAGFFWALSKLTASPATRLSKKLMLV